MEPNMVVVIGVEVLLYITRVGSTTLAPTGEWSYAYNIYTIMQSIYFISCSRYKTPGLSSYPCCCNNINEAILSQTRLLLINCSKC